MFDPSWSPRGDAIAFASGIADGNYSIYVVSSRGGTARRLTPRRLDAGGATSWDSQGRQIAFTTGTSDLAPKVSRELYVVRGDGTGLRRLTRNRADDTMPSWSPRSSSIAFVRGRDGYYELYVIRPRQATARRMTAGSSDRFPSWSHDGREVAFVRNSVSIYTITLGRRHERRLVVSASEKEYTAFSPTSKTLAYWGNGLWVRDSRGRTRRVGGAGRLLVSPLVWSPDGRRIAFQVSDSDIYDVKRIWVVHVASGKRTVVGTGWGGMSWSPDSTKLVVAPGTKDLYVIRVDKPGSERRIAIRYPAH